MSVGSSPGPWAWDPEDPEDGQPYSLFRKGVPYSESGLSVYFEPGGDMTDTDRANLTIIRLAPDMAAMLRELEWYGGSCQMCGVQRFTGRAGEGMAEHLVPVDAPPHAPDCRLAALLLELPK